MLSSCVSGSDVTCVRSHVRVGLGLGQRVETLFPLSGGHAQPDESTCCQRDGRRRAHNACGGDKSMCCRLDGRMQAGDGEGRFSTTDQRQRTLQRRVLVVILNSSQKLLFTKSIHCVLTLSSLGNLNKLTAPLPCTLWHPGKMHK